MEIKEQGAIRISSGNMLFFKKDSEGNISISLDRKDYYPIEPSGLSLIANSFKLWAKNEGK